MSYSFNQSQIDIAATIIRVGQQMGATFTQIRAALAAAWVESRFQNLSYGDRDSLGVFQQRPSQGLGTAAQIMNVEYAASKFYVAAKRVSNAGTAGEIAQRVQRSAYPSRYDEQIGAADEILRRLGNLPASDGVFAGSIGVEIALFVGLGLVILLTD